MFPCAKDWRNGASRFCRSSLLRIQSRNLSAIFVPCAPKLLPKSFEKYSLCNCNCNVLKIVSDKVSVCNYIFHYPLAVRSITVAAVQINYSAGDSVTVVQNSIPNNKSKKPLTNPRFQTRAWGPRKRGLERGWQKRLAKGWRKVGEGLAKGWHRVGERVGKGLAGFLAPSNFAIPEAPV